MSEQDGPTTTVAQPPAGWEQLRLTGDERAAVQRCGSIVAEQRAHGLVYKLRFRLGTRQRVRYLGSDPDRIALVREQLAELQRERVLDRERQRELRRLIDQASQQLRQAKVLLQPLLAAAGLHYHGQAIRRERQASLPNAPSKC